MWALNREDRSDSDVTLGIDHYSVQGALALSLALLPLLAAFREDVRPFVPVCASVAAFYLGLVSLAWPNSPGGFGRAWSVAAMAWALDPRRRNDCSSPPDRATPPGEIGGLTSSAFAHQVTAPNTRAGAARCRAWVKLRLHEIRASLYGQGSSAVTAKLEPSHRAHRGWLRVVQWPGRRSQPRDQLFEPRRSTRLAREDPCHGLRCTIDADTYTHSREHAAYMMR